MQVEPYFMVTATVENGEMVFARDQDFEQAISHGLFRVKVPDGINLEVGRQFARSFSDDEKYTKVFHSPIEGFVTSPLNQVVAFSLSRKNWSLHYSTEVQELGNSLAKIGLILLRGCFLKLGIPERDWDQAASGCLSGKESIFFGFNCYDPKRGDGQKPGCKAHRDWGFITILDVYQPGLEVKVNGVYRPVVIEDGYLTINFGRTFETLTQNRDKQVTAVWHQVIPQVDKMRISSLLHVDPSSEMISTYESGKLVEAGTLDELFADGREEILGKAK